MRVLAVLIATLALAGCGPDEEFSFEPRVLVTSFYPLAWATEQVAGASTRSEVVNLTPPGVEPHDIELTPGDVETIRAAELVVYIGGGFQPAVEDAVAGRDGRSSTSSTASRIRTSGSIPFASPRSSSASPERSGVQARRSAWSAR